ncbi:MAG: N-acyl-D-amino-acid deacylase, partial [Candidatus Binatia bacterium]
MNCQWKLSGGLVVDGTGASAYRADVAVGDLADVEAEHIIDCSDRVVTPGFIDIHSHSDFLMPGTDASALVEPFLRQGMSTLVGGNCGFSPAPLTEKNHSVTRESSRLIIDDEIDLRWETMDGFLSALDEGGVPLNVAELVGHEAVRAAVMGHLDSSVPDEQQLDSMERLVREALDAGVGVSTGLGYPPAISAEHDELARVAGWAAAAGLDVAFDAFPYTAGNTTASVLFPPEMLPHLETILEPPEQLEGLKTLGAQLFAQNGFYLEDIQIMRANATRFDEL